MATESPAWLQGKKTYIVMGLAILTGAAQGLGLIDPATAETFYTALGFGAVGTVAARVSRTAKEAAGK